MVSSLTSQLSLSIEQLPAASHQLEAGSCGRRLAADLLSSAFSGFRLQAEGNEVLRCGITSNEAVQ